MAGTDVKNDIKILFFIINTMNALVPGISIFSVGVTFTVRPVPGPHIPIAIAIGLVLLAVAVLGYAGAIRQSKIMLFIYTGIMVLGVIAEIVVVAMNPEAFDLLFATITLLCFGTLGGSLAAVLAVKGGRPGNRGMVLSPPPAAYTPVV